MKKEEFVSLAARLADDESPVSKSYFGIHSSRLWDTGKHFDLWNLKGKRVLDIGPFFSYVPFALHEQGNQVSVLEGPDGVIAPLMPLYADRKIDVKVIDLFDVFQSIPAQERRLPYPDNHFDIVNCWETMEHFNFNPVHFVREIRRVLKPGGQAFITVPNMAKLDQRIKLLLGKSIRNPVSTFQQYADSRFLGLHWREYVLDEIRELFQLQQFRIESARHLLTFQDRSEMGTSRRLARFFVRRVCSVVPSCGSLCCVRATKQ